MIILIVKLSRQDICRKTTMIVSISDAGNKKAQAENLLQIHEKLQHGSIPRGMWHEMCADVIISSNYEEPERHLN